MALRAVIGHPKFEHLKVLLTSNKSTTLGYLECLWHFCGRFTPAGNIGKYTDAQIEAWLEWNGEPGALIVLFLEAGWIDRDPEYRLLVHDWHKHADDATKLSLKRGEQEFCLPTVSRQCSDSVPTPSRLPVPEPVPVPVPVPENGINPPKPPKGGTALISICLFLPTDWESAREPWNDYQEHRRHLSGVSPYQELGCKKLAAILVSENYGPDKFVRLLDHCVASGWKGIPVEVIKTFEHGRGSNGSAPKTNGYVRTTLDGMVDKMMEESQYGK